MSKKLILITVVVIISIVAVAMMFLTPAKQTSITDSIAQKQIIKAPTPKQPVKLKEPSQAQSPTVAPTIESEATAIEKDLEDIDKDSFTSSSDDDTELGF